MFYDSWMWNVNENVGKKFKKKKNQNILENSRNILKPSEKILNIFLNFFISEFWFLKDSEKSHLGINWDVEFSSLFYVWFHNMTCICDARMRKEWKSWKKCPTLTTNRLNGICFYHFQSFIVYSLTHLLHIQC